MEIIKTEKGCRDYLLRLSKPVRKWACWEYHKVSFLRGPRNELISGGEGWESLAQCNLALPPYPSSPPRLLLISLLLKETGSKSFVWFHHSLEIAAWLYLGSILLLHCSLFLALEYLYIICIQGAYKLYLCPSVHQNMLCTDKWGSFSTFWKGVPRESLLLFSFLPFASLSLSLCQLHKVDRGTGLRCWLHRFHGKAWTAKPRQASSLPGCKYFKAFCWWYVTANSFCPLNWDRRLRCWL